MHKNPYFWKESENFGRECGSGGVMETYLVKKVDKPLKLEGDVPGSKSITNRALLMAAMAEGESLLKGVLFSDDSRYFLQALKDLGFVVKEDFEKKQEIGRAHV